MTIVLTAPSRQGDADAICAGCGKEIDGVYVQASGKSYHSECFVCASCHTGLKGQRFTVEAEGPLCQACWAKVM